MLLMSYGFCAHETTWKYTVHLSDLKKWTELWWKAQLNY